LKDWKAKNILVLEAIKPMGGPKQYNNNQVSSPMPEIEESSWLCSQPGAVVAMNVW
jgi:hypothetical protein